MGREVRRVPKDWKHPENERTGYIPLFDRYTKHVTEWDEEAIQWANGLRKNCVDNTFVPRNDRDKGMTYTEYAGERPKKEQYMPEWPKEEKTHLQMYETCSEGSPISPVMETPEKLARWLADNEASSFGSMTASYEAWLRVCKGGYAPSAIMTSGKGIESGVEGVKEGGKN